ncbi:lysozyme inhibitor LprI family protein [Tropicimonas sp. IMCC6043]|uniref:lysozyme inhibitor LprI family protein n=1 Tax=Tropicimonas sp. IMCC6043 TaxID=2510645 RepID=UPI00101C88A1|nr:hypothetical protein [Tropicimonas sp. IMCC6043]RYH07609.1 hypothetical protein EU800_19605 [Tropicimonas sp. IMCC6043]
MRYFFLSTLLAALAILHQRDVLAEEVASFDCAKASTAVEQTICEDAYSMLMDREIARQFDALQSTHPGIVAEQLNWLKQRNRCQDDRICLWTALADRWVALGRQIEENLGIPKLSGVYDYVVRPEEIAGDLTLAAGPGGDYGFFISTVTLTHGHLCEVMGANASRAEAGEVFWRIPETGRALTLTPGDDGVVTLAIEYDDERSFCGARAYLYGPYRLTADGGN